MQYWILPYHQQPLEKHGIWGIDGSFAFSRVKGEQRRGECLAEKDNNMSYGFSRTVSLPYDSAVEKVTEELKKEGFGILTTIDVKETLKEKLNVEFNKYIILGACNPPFAYQALQAEEQVGLLLPCNVIVYEKDDKTILAAFDPMSMAKVMDNDAMEPIADQVRAKLLRAINAVG
jgi:uncharacterized protein (DUF302 family)